MIELKKNKSLIDSLQMSLELFKVVKEQLELDFMS